MTDIAEASRALMDAAKELDGLSRKLVEIERELAPIELDLTAFVEDFKVALWQKHVDDGEKHPPEETRNALAHRAFETDRYHRALALRAARARAKGRLSDLREIVAAQRSIVSAAKTELEATEGPQPQWSGA